jgi:hypothetical protein
MADVTRGLSMRKNKTKEPKEASEAQQAYWAGGSVEGGWRDLPLRDRQRHGSVVKFTPRQWAQVKGLAEKRQMSIQALIRSYLIEALERDAQAEL